jgi:N-ethylmaleimide reductase
MDGLDYGYHGLSPAVTLYDMKKAFEGVIIGNVGYTRESAEGTVRAGVADLIAFGRPYLANPDLVQRFEKDLPLNPVPDRSCWYGRYQEPQEVLQGYTDFKPYRLD